MAIGMKTWKPSIYDWERSELQRTNETARALGQEGIDPEQIRAQTMGTLDAEGKFRLEDAKWRAEMKWQKEQYWNNLRAQWSKDHAARKEKNAAGMGKIIGFGATALDKFMPSIGAAMGGIGDPGVSASNRALGDSEWSAWGYDELPASEQASIGEQASIAKSSSGPNIAGTAGTVLGGVLGSFFGMPGLGAAGGGMIGNAAGGMTVICTELHRQGYLDDYTIYLDCLYGASIDYDVWLGYYHTFVPLVRSMRKSKLLTKIVYILANPVIKEMAHRMDKSLKGTIRGKIVLHIGEPLCAIRGYMLRRKLWAVS